MGVMNQPQISHTQGLCQKAAQLIGVEIPHTHLLIDAVAPLEDSLAQSPVLLRYPVPLSRLCCPVGALLLSPCVHFQGKILDKREALARPMRAV